MSMYHTTPIIEKARSLDSLCQFGPGGDFALTWSSDQDASQRNAFVGLGQALLGMVGAVFGLYSDSPPAISDFETHTSTPESIEESDHAEPNTQSVSSSHAASTSDTGGHILFPAESWLFPDDGRVGTRIIPKPKHRVRTHVRAPLKKTPLDLPGQGTLFEVDFPRARTA